ncbi:AAA family ATPase [Nocardia tengchongensis]
MSESTLFGRDTELARLAVFLDGGEAVLLEGEPGVGKSALLAATARRAETCGMKVLRASGSEFEADISYAALNQLLLPLYARLAELAADQHRRDVDS